MKNYILTFCLLFTFIFANTQTLSDKQFTMITKKTADWCPFCGTWGWNFTNNLNTRLADKDVLLWAVHYSGNLANPTTTGVASNLGGTGQPLFFVNEDNMDVTSSNVSAKLGEIEQTVDILNSFAPITQMGVDAILEGGTVNVNAKVKFTDDIANGEYYVGIYLIKDKLVAPQASVSNSAVHTNVLDKSLLPVWYGNLIATAPISNGSTFDVSAVIENFVPHTANLEDSKIAVITWNKLNNKYVFLNAGISPVKLQSSIDPLVDGKKLGCKCEVFKGNINVELMNNLPNDTQISLFDTNGKMISNRFTSVSQKDFNVDTHTLTTGVYFVHVKSGNQSLTRPVFVQ